jgi:hypothetical protein
MEVANDLHLPAEWYEARHIPVVVLCIQKEL